MRKIRALIQRWAPHTAKGYVNHLCRVQLERPQLEQGSEGPWWILSGLEILDEVATLGLPVLHTGYVDSHLHMSLLGDMAFQWDLREIKSVEQFESELKQRLASEDQQILKGFGFSEKNLGLTLEQLPQFFDRILPADSQVIVSRICGHSAGVSMGLRKQCNFADFPSFITDAQLMKLWERLPPPSLQSVEDSWRHAQSLMLAQGYVAVGDMSLDSLMVQALQNLAHSGKLEMDVQGVFEAGRCLDLEAEGPQVLKSVDVSPHLSRHATLQLLHWKRYLDGSLGSRTAWLSQPYADHTSTGESLIDDETLFSQAEQALKKGFLLSFHTIGDKSLDQALRVGEKFSKDMKINSEKHSLLHRLEHVQMARPDQIKSLANQKLWSVHLQPRHRVSDDVFIHQRLNSQFYKSTAYRVNSFLKNNISLALGSDAPIDREDPKEILKACSSHIVDEENISREDAIWHMTTGAKIVMGLPGGLLRVGTRVILS